MCSPSAGIGRRCPFPCFTHIVFKVIVVIPLALGLAVLPGVGCRDALAPQPAEQTRPDSGAASNRNAGDSAVTGTASNRNAGDSAVTGTVSNRNTGDSAVTGTASNRNAGDSAVTGTGDSAVTGTASNRNTGDSAVTGTVSYSEDMPLSPGALLEVELHDVSLVDAASKLIARQVVSDLGRPPVPFRVEYDREDIQAGNVYAVQARIKYRDGSLAFVSDTAYEVITQGRPDEVEMVLVMAGPPPGDTPGNITPAPGDWVVIPAGIRTVRVERNNSGYTLTAAYFLPGGEDCARLEDSRIETVDRDIHVSLNILVKRAANGDPSCASPPAEGVAAMEVDKSPAPGKVYRARINDRLMAVFTPPREGLYDSRVALSPIESAELVILEIDPPVYNVVVNSALPRGSSCSQFDGFSIERSRTGHRIELSVTHHEVSDPGAVCTKDYPTVDTTIPLGSDFEPGEEYMIFINVSDTSITFSAQ